MSAFVYNQTVGGACTKLELQVSAGYTVIYNVSSIEGPSISRGTRDTTPLCSTWKEFAPTVADGGEITANVFLAPADASQQIMYNLLTDPSNYTFRILFQDGSHFDFEACVTGFAVSGIEIEGTVMGAIKMKVNGPISWSAT